MLGQLLIPQTCAVRQRESVVGRKWNPLENRVLLDKVDGYACYIWRDRNMYTMNERGHTKYTAEDQQRKQNKRLCERIFLRACMGQATRIKSYTSINTYAVPLMPLHVHATGWRTPPISLCRAE